ncbi:hypothetical protein HH213_09130 [Duganella dendranthematis]|jgi:hypothetical protein|uniref:DUF3592 domain-containing protein n=1 Tax=Duganella dendranthematis TaxID=2728021 RepID=A0ABX6M7T4_9BURK|nr:DUF6216 family protein [Duganella dendranthematis]QJD90243.1 hypothetical protein HH213_09130 [Duganella dendranthematis]
MDGINALNSAGITLIKGLVLAILPLVLAAAIIWWRTRSGHTIFTRIWAFFASSRSTTSLKSIKQFHEKRAALLHFRFTTGLSVRTHHQMDRVVCWTEEKDEDVGDIARCGGFFDLERLELREGVAKIKWWYELLPFFLALILGIAGLGAGALMVPGKALLQVTETKKNILLSESYVKPLNGKGFRLAACSTGLPENTGFTEREQRIICDAAKDRGMTETVTQSVEEQRWVLGFFSAFLLFSVIPFWTFFREMASARAMHARLAKPATQNETPGKTKEVEPAV